MLNTNKAGNVVVSMLFEKKPGGRPPAQYKADGYQVHQIIMQSIKIKQNTVAIVMIQELHCLDIMIIAIKGERKVKDPVSRALLLGIKGK